MTRSNDQRSPRKRLVSILQDQTVNRATRRFGALLEALTEPADCDACLRAVDALHREGMIGDNERLYFLGRVAESFIRAVFSTDPVLTDLVARMQEIERAHGLGEDEAWLVGEGPPEWESLNARSDERMDELMVAALRASGAADAADMFEQSPDDFDFAGMLGRQEFESRWKPQKGGRDPLAHFLDS